MFSPPVSLPSGSPYPFFLRDTMSPQVSFVIPKLSAKRKPQKIGTKRSRHCIRQTLFICMSLLSPPHFDWTHPTHPNFSFPVKTLFPPPPKSKWSPSKLLWGVVEKLIRRCLVQAFLDLFSIPNSQDVPPLFWFPSAAPPSPLYLNSSSPFPKSMR